MSDDAPRDREKARRWSIPPVPPWRREEAQILRDVDDPLATTLWRAVRDVRAWVETPAADRSEIVRQPNAVVRERLAYAARQAPELTGALAQFTHLLQSPTSVRGDALAAACAVVGEWAEANALSETSVQFAEAAATVADEHPAFANLAARVCKRAALHDRAEVWYQRGIGLARQQKDTVEYINARLGYGALLRDLGDVDRGKYQILKAARRAAQSGRREQAAETQHDLLNIYGEAGSLRQALDFAEAALQNYPVHHRRLPFFAHDFAHFLITQSLYAEAYRLAIDAVRLIRQQDQALAWGTVGLAAAGAGLRDRYDAARQQGESLAALYPQFGPGTLMMLSQGALMMSEWDVSERLAAQALAIAQERADAQIVADAHALLDRVATRSVSPQLRVTEKDRRVESLLANISYRLRMWKPA